MSHILFMLIHTETHLLFVRMSHSHPEWHCQTCGPHSLQLTPETSGATSHVSTVLVGGAVQTPQSSVWGLSEVQSSPAPQLTDGFFPPGKLSASTQHREPPRNMRKKGTRCHERAQRPAGRLTTPYYPHVQALLSTIWACPCALA